jgi:nicotinate-nucleotide adenylyltransferase
MRIGIFGGSFDPIHLGHLLAASEAAAALGLERVLFVTAARPPHKTPVAPAEARHEMVLLATARDPRFEASRLELDRPGPSYTVDTLLEAQRRYPAAELFFITGADAYNDADSWHQAERLDDLAHLVAVTRPGHTPQIHPFFQERTRLLEIPGYDVSSSEIRKRLREGRTVRYLLPLEVEVYIGKHGFYRVG